MKVTFPYMGTVVIYKKLLELLGHEVIVPPRPSQKTLDLGVKHSPEFACFPFKTIMGSYIEACEMGAEAIVTSGGHGPCRAGFYSEVHQRELLQLGYEVDFIVFDSIYRDKDRFLQQVKKLKGNQSWLKVMKSIFFTYQMVREIDKLEMKLQKIRPYEVKQGETTKVWQKIEKVFDKVMIKQELKAVVRQGYEWLDAIERAEVSPMEQIKIGIVGEIFVVMESSINMEIEKVMGELGCEVERSHYLSEWVKDNMLPSLFKNSHEEEILKKGEPYIEINIGGHAKQTVGQIIDFKERGYDGIIHLMPFGCLPELISQSITPKLSKEYDIPILTLSLDEQTGQANNRTRLEAFIDLIKNKKIRQYSA